MAIACLKFCAYIFKIEMQRGWRDMTKRNSIMFHGFRIVRLHDEFAREAQRVVRLCGMIAILQKNGNVAISNSGIFDNVATTTRGTKLRVARSNMRVAAMLCALKLVSSEIAENYLATFDDLETARKIQDLKDEAEHLGLKVSA